MVKNNKKDKVKHPYFRVNPNEGEEELIDLETLSLNKDNKKEKRSKNSR